MSKNDKNKSILFTSHIQQPKQQTIPHKNHLGVFSVDKLIANDNRKNDKKLCLL